MKEVLVYTDGACTNNPGPGGYGVVLLYGDKRKELSGGFQRTTNNRMELMAVIKGLETLKEPCVVRLYSDSKYVVDAIEKGWLTSWKLKNWKRGKKDDVLNVDLWKRIDKLLSIHDVKFIWIKGHNANKENERCDLLARNAIVSGELEEDLGYGSS